MQLFKKNDAISMNNIFVVKVNRKLKQKLNYSFYYDGHVIMLLKEMKVVSVASNYHSFSMALYILNFIIKIFIDLNDFDILKI